jgi:hypothetical protein
MVHSLVRGGAVEVSTGVAELDRRSGFEAPLSLVAAVGRRLDFLTPLTREALRWAALLGTEFTLAEIAQLLGQSVFALVEPVDEAIHAGVLIDAGTRLAFRHPLLRQALYEGMPLAIRIALHRQAAQTLAECGAPPDRVAGQLVAAPVPADSWVLQWLTEHLSEVIHRVPSIALDLLRAVLAQCPSSDRRWALLMAGLVRATLRLGRNPELPARQVLAATGDPQRDRDALPASRHAMEA